MLCATLLLPVPGGPARQRIVAGWSAPTGASRPPSRAASERIRQTARYSRMRSFTSLRPKWVRSRCAATAVTSTSAGAILPHGSSTIVSRRLRMTATSGLIGDVCLSLRSSRSASFAGRGRKLGLGEATSVLGQVLVRRLAGLLDLVADDLHLLVQEELALRALDTLLHPVHDVLLDAEDGCLFGQGLDERDEALLRGFHAQERLLLLAGDLQVRGDDVGDSLGVLGLTHDVLHLVGDLRVELHVRGELAGHAPRQ